MATFNQIYTLVNAITQESIGGTGITVKDTASFVTLGNLVLSSSDNTDEFYNKLPDVIGRIVTRYYTVKRRDRGLDMDPIEWGIAIEEIERSQIARAKQNKSWGDQPNPFAMLRDDTAFDVSIYSVLAGWELNKLTYDHQLQTAFHNEIEMTSFLSMIMQDMYDGMTQAKNDTDKLCEATAMAQSVAASVGTSPKRTAFNLLTAYKTDFPSSTITAATARRDTDFLRYSTEMMLNVLEDAQGDISTLYNVAGYEKELDDDYRFHMLAEFANALSIYLRADTYHEDLVKLPGFSKVKSWQGSGTADSFDDKSTINVTNGDITVELSGIVAHIFARGRCMTMIDKIRTKSLYNPIGEMTNWAHKADIGYAVRPGDIGIVFYIADEDWEPAG